MFPGWTLGYVVFTSLEAQGLMDLSQFLLVTGIVFIVTTTTIAIFKKEKSLSEIQESQDEGSNEEVDLGLIEAYKMLWKIVSSPKMVILIIFLLTNSFGFSATEELYKLKLVEFGVPRDTIAQLALPMIPVQIFVVLIMSRHIAGHRPMNIWLGTFPVRFIFCVLLTLLVSPVQIFTFSSVLSGVRHCHHKDGGWNFSWLLLLPADQPLHPPPGVLAHHGPRPPLLLQQDQRPPRGRHLHDPPQHLR